MSDAILAFQSQLSGVMETVFKAAMYEITRLVEDSFLEEVSRSREQVETLKQRLQWAETRRREREGVRARCADCGRARAPGDGGEGRAAGAESAVDEGRGLKQERVLGGDWSSCPGEASNPGPLNAPEEATTPSPVGVPAGYTQTTDLDGDRLDAMLKEESLQAAAECCDLQERWRACLEGHEGGDGLTADGGFGEWGSSLGPDTDPAHDGDTEEISQEYRSRYGGMEELSGLEPAPKSEYIAQMLGSGELDEQGLDDSLLRAGGQLGFGAAGHAPAELDPAGVADVPVHPLIPRGKRTAFADRHPSPPGSPRDSADVDELDCLLINEDGFLQDTDGRYQVQRRGRMRTRGEQRDLGACGNQLLPAEGDHELQPQGETFGISLASDILQQSQKGQRRYSCTQCQVSCPDLASLKAHLLTHKAGSAYTCTQCGKSFTQACNLKVHQRIHSGEGLHLCSHCGKGFISFADLKRHKCSHTSEKPYCCTLCGNKFSRLWNLKLHRRIHTQEKPHRCNQCGKSFTRADILKVHQRTHTGERPYCCTVCGLSFKRLDHLKSHQRKHS
ncbi:zinc finger protein 696-like isoform X2 [Megalops cyprinoides]|uniref:zinc finger protein 696-like isoform X2 n=1 Tax=Megalops cyprinoides TaxID=118141 RepID=UPI0018654595|nr:zinc finger protein 696-like isoform X2 [Megalops cyprinoides]